MAEGFAPNWLTELAACLPKDQRGWWGARALSLTHSRLPPLRLVVDTADSAGLRPADLTVMGTENGRLAMPSRRHAFVAMARVADP